MTKEKKVYELFTHEAICLAARDYDKKNNNSFENYCKKHESLYTHNDIENFCKITKSNPMNYWKYPVFKSIDYLIKDFNYYEDIYDNKVYDMFRSKNGVDRLFMQFNGNRLFYVKFYSKSKGEGEFLQIYGLKRASKIAHMISMSLGQSVAVCTKEYKVILKIKCYIKSVSNPYINYYDLKIYADNHEIKTIDTFGDCLQKLTEISNELNQEGINKSSKEIDITVKKLKYLFNTKNIEINYGVKATAEKVI